MKLSRKKIIAKEILIITFILITCAIVYIISLNLENFAKNKNAAISKKIDNIGQTVNKKLHLIENLNPRIDLNDISSDLKPWQTFNRNGKPRFDATKPYIILDSDFYKKFPKITERLRKDSIKGISLKKNIIDLIKKRKILESQITKNYDISLTMKYFICCLLILAYPLRLIILGVIWSIKIIKEN